MMHIEDSPRNCPHGGTSDEAVVSRHTTTEGVVIYTRCPCGILRMWHHIPGTDHVRLLARGRQGDAAPAAPAAQPALVAVSA